MTEPTLKKQAGFLFTAQIISFLIISVSPIILVRLMNENDYGSYQQVLFIATLILSIVHFRMPGSLYYFYPRVENQVSDLLNQTILVMGLTGLLGALVCYVMASSGLLPAGIESQLFLILSVYIFIESMGQLLDHLFVLEKKPEYTLYKGIINNIVKLSLVVGAVLLTGEVKAIVIGLSIYAGLRLLVVLAYVAKKYQLSLTIVDVSLLKKQIKYVLPLAAANIIGIIGLKLDKLFIGYQLDPASFAVYTLGGLGLMSAVTMLYTSVGNVCLPKLSGYADKNQRGQARDLWHTMIFANAAVTIPVVVFCAYMAPEIMTILFTEKFIAAADIWRINLFILLIQMLGYGYIPTAFGKTGSILKANIIRFAISLPLVYFLVKDFGLEGAAIAFVIGFWINALMQLKTGKKELGASMAEFLPWKKLFQISGIALVSCLSIYYLENRVESVFLDVLITAAGYFSIVIICLFIFRIVKIDNIKMLLKGKGNMNQP